MKVRWNVSLATSELCPCRPSFPPSLLSLYCDCILLPSSCHGNIGSFKLCRPRLECKRRSPLGNLPSIIINKYGIRTLLFVLLFHFFFCTCSGQFSMRMDGYKLHFVIWIRCTYKRLLVGQEETESETDKWKVKLGRVGPHWFLFRQTCHRSEGTWQFGVRNSTEANTFFLLLHAPHSQHKSLSHTHTRKCMPRSRKCTLWTHVAQSRLSPTHTHTHTRANPTLSDQYCITAECSSVRGYSERWGLWVKKVSFLSAHLWSSMEYVQCVF